MTLTRLIPNIPIVAENGTMTEIFNRFLNELYQLSLLTGEGSPEGVISAERGVEYMDTLGTTGNIKYIKRDAAIGGDDTKGWVLI